MTDAQSLDARLQRLLRELDAWPDSSDRARVSEMLGTVMELHTEGLRRIVRALEDSGDAGSAILHRLASDDLIASVLMLHDLHPHTLENRVQRALNAMALQLHGQGASAELTACDNGTVAVRLRTSGKSCPSSRAALRLAVEGAVRGSAADAEHVVINEDHETPPPRSVFVPAASLTLNSRPIGRRVPEAPTVAPAPHE